MSDRGTAGRPLVRFLGHGAERSGPPIYLLRLLQHWSNHDPGFDREVVVARPGPLVPDYQAVAPIGVARLDRRSPERVAERALQALGADAAGRGVVDGAVRLRSRPLGRPTTTVVNGATAGTVQLLRALHPDEPVVMIAHELSTGWYDNIDDAARRLLLGSTRFLAVSECVERFLTKDLRVSPAQITVVPTPVNATEEPDRLRPASTDQVVIGGGGMTDWRKAPELWLRVAHEARRLAPDLDLRFVWFGGTDPSGAGFWPLRHEIDHLGLGDAVEFLGDVTEPAQVRRRLDLFVSTAREDAYPLVCAEAASAGLPVVSFDGGGAAELIASAECGGVIRYPDTEAMAALIVDLARDRARRTALGARGRDFARRQLDVSVVAPRVAEWIRAGSQR